MEENLERKLLNRGRAFATFSTIEKALAGRMLCRPLYRISNTTIVWPSQQAKLTNKKLVSLQRGNPCQARKILNWNHTNVLSQRWTF